MSIVFLFFVIVTCTTDISVEDYTGYVVKSSVEEKCCNASNSRKVFASEDIDTLELVFCPLIPPDGCKKYSSCSEILLNSPNAISGYYKIYDFTERDGQSYKSEHVYCSFEMLCNSTGPWTRIAHLNMSDPLQNCPIGFKLHEANGTRACGRPYTPSGSCIGIQFSSINLNYSEVCGRIKGYQFGSPDAIDTYYGAAEFNNISSYYADGISITQGYSRVHVWTLMAGLDEYAVPAIGGNPFCPCAGNNSTMHKIQYFVGNDYYCESGNSGKWEAVPIFSDPLWDGEDCNGNEQNCCNASYLQPWFYKILPASDDYIELRVCADQSTDNEDVLFGEYELYIK